MFEKNIKQYGCDIWFLNIIIALSSKYNPSITILTTDITMRQAIVSYNKKKIEISNLSDFKIILSISSGVTKAEERDFYKD